MATDFEGLRARMAAMRLRVDIAKAGTFDEGKHPRFPKGTTSGGEFAPASGGLGAWFASFFGKHDIADPNWAASKGPQVPWHTIERKGSVLHPFPDDQGRDAFIHRPSTPTPASAPEWKSPDGVVTVTPGSATPKGLNGVAFRPFEAPEDWRTVAGQHPQLEDGLPDLENIKGMHPAAGVIIQEPDGRVWLTKPLNGYGGYKHTFPKGTQEHGLTLQQTAIKEAWEETGLKVELVGVLGDFRRTTSVARYYVARRTGGTPSAQGWESQAMRLVPPDKIISFLNLHVDREIWRAYKGEDDVTKERSDPFLARSALLALQDRIDALSVRVGIAKAFEEGKHPRWPKGSPLGGQFMPTDGSGLPLPPTIGSKANPGFQNKANAAYEAAKAGDTAKVNSILADLQTKVDKYGYTAGAGPAAAYATGPHSQAKWAQQAHQYVQQLSDTQKSASVANLMADGGGPAADPVSDLTQYKKIGGKLGGTSAGAQYQGPDGAKYYVKGTSGQGIASADRAKNEVLASKLLQAAGAGAPDMHLVTNLPPELGGAKAVGVASKLVNGVPLTPSSGSQAIMAAQKDFAAHAWLANYDVMGLGHDNTLVLPGNKVVNIDPGGGLLHRAQGAVKYPDLPYGAMPHQVDEWNTLRDKAVNSQTAAIYGGMTKGDLQASAAKLANLDDKTISDLVAKYGPGTPEQKLTLANSLIERRNDILKKADLALPKSPGNFPKTSTNSTLKPDAFGKPGDNIGEVGKAYLANAKTMINAHVASHGLGDGTGQLNAFGAAGLHKAITQAKTVADISDTINSIKDWKPTSPELVEAKKHLLAATEHTTVSMEMPKIGAGEVNGVTAIYGHAVPKVTHPDLKSALKRIHQYAEAGEADMVSSIGSGVYGLAGSAHEKDAVNSFAQNVAGKMVEEKAAGAPGPWNDWSDGPLKAGKPDPAPFAEKVAHIKPLTKDDLVAASAVNYAQHMRLAAYKGDTAKIGQLLNEAKVHPVIGGPDGDGGTTDYDKLHQYAHDLRAALGKTSAGYTHSFAGSTVTFTGEEWKAAAANVDYFYKTDKTGDMLAEASSSYHAAANSATGDAKANFTALAQHTDNLLAKMQEEAAPATAKLPYYSAHLTNTTEGHNKFWKATVHVNDDGTATMVKSWGKIGTAGQGMEQHFTTPKDAAAEAAKQVQAKVNGGYVAQAPVTINAEALSGKKPGQQTYAGSGYQKANEERHNAAQAKGPAIGDKGPFTLVGEANAAVKGKGLFEAGHNSPLDIVNQQVAQSLIDGNGTAFKAGMAKLEGWKSGDPVKSQALAHAYLEHWNGLAKLTGQTPYATALGNSVGKPIDAGHLVEDATGLKFNPEGNQLHQHVSDAVAAFNAGNDKGMATAMGHIGMVVAADDTFGASHLYNKLEALAQTKADHFPLATGGQTTSVAHTDQPKPAASHVTHDSGGGSAAAPAPVKTPAPALPNFQHTTKSSVDYYTGIAQKMQDAYSKGDLSGILAASVKPKSGNPVWPVFESGEKAGTPKTINGKLLADYQTQLVKQLNEHNAAKIATELEKPAVAVSPGEHVGNNPALPNFDRQMIPTTNTNAASHNAKVFQIKTLAMKGDVKGLLALNYGTNTYGKKQAALANDALAALGSDFKVVPGQKKNSHFALTSTGNQQVPPTTHKTALSAALTDKELPAKIDFSNYNGAGKGLSSKPFVNKANQQAFDHLIDLAKAGDMAGIKAATFQPIDPATGNPVGKPLPINQHPSQHIKNTQITLLQTMDEKLHPPEPLKFFEGKAFQSVAQASDAVPPKPFGTTKAKHPSSQTIGYFLALGQVSQPDALVPQKTFNLTPESKSAAASDYNKMSGDAKKFVSTMQGSGGKKFADPGHGGGGYSAAEWEKITVAAHKYATELPVGTRIYKWDNLTPDMKQKLALAQPGLIIQNPAPVCTSYSPTSTKGFGSSHRFKIIIGPGAKVISSFGSGHYAGEGELSLLPNNRLMILSHKKNAGDGWAETTVLLLPPDPALEKKAKALPY